MIAINPNNIEESIMSNFKKSNFPAAVVMSIPLLVLGGCAGHESVKMTASNDISQPKSIETMELVIDKNSEYEDLQATDTSLQTTEVVDTVTTVIEAKETTIAIENAKTPQPVESIIGFAFDKSNIAPEYGELLWQHAQYLKENKNIILRLSGHTDSMGSSSYNQLLSKKRADKVAQVLIDFGVDKNQIKVTANANDIPLVGAINMQEHRRVELNYEDTQFVSN